MSALTPEFFDMLIIAVVLIGLALAVVRLYADFTRPLPPEPPPPSHGDRQRRSPDNRQ
ncbi:MAG: hypothetical protein DIU68_014505 [Chloroflexota bacterium]